MDNPTSILITGASSGIGAALARHYAREGVTLHLQGRDAARLQQVADNCTARKATVHSAIIDVTDADAMERWILSSDNTAPIDLVIANAGISAGTGDHGESDKQVRQIFNVNIGGVLNTIQPLIPRMSARKRGQVAIMSSLAGMRGLPSSPAYSASKACVRFYGEALRGWLQPHGVEVSVICPGYIITPMTAVNNFPMPFKMSAEKSARIIALGLARNRGRIGFPWPMYALLWFLSCLSPVITDPLFARLPAKPAAPDLR